MKITLFRQTSLALASFLACGPSWAATVEYFDQLAFAASLSSSQTLTTISFDTLSRGSGVILGDEYLPNGISIIQRDGLPINVLRAEDIEHAGFPILSQNVNSPPNAISSSFDVGGVFRNARSDNFDFVLTTPAQFAGLWVGNLGSGANTVTEVQFLDTAGSVLSSEVLSSSHVGVVTGLSQFDNRIFYGVKADAGLISRIRTIEIAGDGDGIVYDDVQFAAAVPEPHSIALFVLGSTVLLTRRRVRKASTEA